MLLGGGTNCRILYSINNNPTKKPTVIDNADKWILGFENSVSYFATNAGRAIGWLVFLIVFSYFFIFMLLGGGDGLSDLNSTLPYSTLSIIACFKSMSMFLTPEKFNTLLNIALVKSTFLENP
jgi:hypothetical protein